MLKGIKYEELAMRDAKLLDPIDLPGLPHTIGGRDQRSGIPLDDVSEITKERLIALYFKDSKARLIMPTSRPGNI